jgi:hypothetical protein
MRETRTPGRFFPVFARLFGGARPLTVPNPLLAPLPPDVASTMTDEQRRRILDALAVDEHEGIAITGPRSTSLVLDFVRLLDFADTGRSQSLSVNAVNQRLGAMKREGLVTGSKRAGWTITDAGRELLAQLEVRQ